MDTLPSEILVHILHFIPPEDNPRLQRISKCFQRLITIHSCYMQRFHNTLTLKRSFEEGEEGIMVVTLATPLAPFVSKVNFEKNEDDDSMPPRIEMKTMDEFSHRFFAPWRTYEGNEQDLMNYFSWLLSKGNATLRVCYDLPSITRDSLQEAIKKTNTRIPSLEFEFPAICNRNSAMECYRLVLEKEKKYKNVPHMLIYPENRWKNLFLASTYMMNLSLIGSNFSDICTIFNMKDVCTVINRFLSYWILFHEPTQRLHFQLKFYGEERCTKDRIECPLLHRIPQDMFVSMPLDFIHTHSLENFPRVVEFGKAKGTETLRFESFRDEDKKTITTTLFSYEL